ncbi:hypothetical protein AJ80_06247 [Polytolypa hystricis UAMH7299]|uniref:Uncharacterized protein n=1 Tax=Polytolypa hystricis (strain UAMH7299) TaxID=1447883 RepID=A0A2B7XXE3_POLH7|nr:hypothetical protein AJ80_06247 [Polytolypa hystricis UAMH7299]
MEPVSTKRLIQNIKLLWILNKIPEHPKENALETELDHNRILRLRDEREIVDNLAILSADTDDSKRVRALCIEEHHNPDRLIVRMSSNSGSLEGTRVGFERIFRILETAAQKRNTRSEDTETLFREVVNFDKKRIMSRLRSKHVEETNRTSGKSILTEQLCHTLSDKLLQPPKGASRKGLAKMKEKATEIHKVFMRFEESSNKKFTDIEILMDLIKIADEINQSGELVKVLLNTSSTPNRSLRESLPKRVGKIGQYLSASRSLISAARKYPIFEHISLEICEPPDQTEFSKQDLTLCLRTALFDVFQGSTRHQKQKLISSVAARKEKPIWKVEADFKSRMELQRKEPWVTHAEIQLLFFYELRPDCARPRVISSSKSACYLCDLFISLHGKYHMRQTHGKLYDAWTLPEWCMNPESGLHGTVVKFNSALESRIKDTVNKKNMPYPQPNESVILPPALWTPSLTNQSRTSTILTALNGRQPSACNSVETIRQSAEQSNKSGQQPPSPAQSSRSVALEAGIPRIKTPIANQCEGPHVLTEHIKSTHPKPPPSPPDSEPVPYKHEPPPSALSSLLSLTNQAYQRLTPGIPTLSSKVCKVATKSIHLTLYPPPPPPPQQASGSQTFLLTRKPRVELKWLDADERDHIDRLAGNVIDAASLTAEDLTLDLDLVGERKGEKVERVLYVCGKRDVIRITACGDAEE